MKNFHQASCISVLEVTCFRNMLLLKYILALSLKTFIRQKNNIFAKIINTEKIF